MNRKLLVTLLHKNIEELNMITESFMEMNEYPQAIVHLAKRKTEDIQTIIDQLAEIKEPVPSEAPTQSISTITEPQPEKVVVPEIVANEPVVEISSSIETIDDIVVEDLTEETVTVVETQEEKTIVVETKEVKEITEINSLHETKIVTDETKKITIADRIVPPVLSRNETMSKSSDNSLSSTLANKKIDDIKQAISIGDRFRFQRELFRGNGEDMNKTLNYINQLATLDEVTSFLMSKYGWQDENPAVEDFFAIIRRKFL
jgi:hypothetical protein